MPPTSDSESPQVIQKKKRTAYTKLPEDVSVVATSLYRASKGNWNLVWSNPLMIPLLEQVQQNETEAKGLHQKNPPQMFPMEKVKKKIQQKVSSISTAKTPNNATTKVR